MSGFPKLPFVTGSVGSNSATELREEYASARDARLLHFASQFVLNDRAAKGDNGRGLTNDIDDLVREIELIVKVNAGNRQLSVEV